ncbi:unnamed protein product, partial [Notodromas monacha]
MKTNASRSSKTEDLEDEEKKKPAGRMSAYAYYLQTCREELRDRFPNDKLDFSQFTRMCNDRWKTMTGDQKARYIHLAKRDSTRFSLEMMIYQEGKSRPIRRWEKDPRRPKRA